MSFFPFRSWLKSPTFAARAPAVLLLAVAALHLALGQSRPLIPWLGGGFGMFSSFDKYWPRALSCEATDSEGNRYTIDWNPSEARGPLGGVFKAKVLSQPTAAELDQVAQLILHAPLNRAYFSPGMLNQALWNAGLLGQIKFRVSAAELGGLSPLATAESSFDPTQSNGLVAVRLQVWRLAFDPKDARVFLKPAVAPFEVKRSP